MDKIHISDQIEITHVPSGGTKITVSGNHAVNLLTYLQEKGIQASGQDAPLFGMDDFPTIYYINFDLNFEVIHLEVLNYLQSLGADFKEQRSDASMNQQVKIFLS